MPTSRTTRQASRRTAFTLVEVLMVTAILAIAAALVVSTGAYLVPRYRLRRAAREVAATVVLARSESIGRGRALALRYDLDAGRYWLAPARADGGLGDRPEPPAERLYEGALPAGVRMAEVRLGAAGREGVVRRGLATVRFGFLGGCDGHSVRLELPGEGTATVEAMSLTAQVSIREGDDSN